MLKVEIETGNAAMIEADDIAEALRAVAQDITNGAVSGRVFDYNGNIVGTWAVDQ